MDYADHVNLSFDLSFEWKAYCSTLITVTIEALHLTLDQIYRFILFLTSMNLYLTFHHSKRNVGAYLIFWFLAMTLNQPLFKYIHLVPRILCQLSCLARNLLFLFSIILFLSIFEYSRLFYICEEFRHNLNLKHTIRFHLFYRVKFHAFFIIPDYRFFEHQFNNHYLNLCHPQHVYLVIVSFCWFSGGVNIFYFYTNIIKWR